MWHEFFSLFVSVSFCLFVIILPLPVSFCLSLSLFVSLCFHLSLCLTLFLFVSLYLFLFLFVSLPLFVFSCFPLPFFIPLSLFASLCLFYLSALCPFLYDCGFIGLRLQYLWRVYIALALYNWAVTITHWGSTVSKKEVRRWLRLESALQDRVS